MGATSLLARVDPSVSPVVPGPSFDYDLHGLVGIRLVDASPADRSAVSAQLGPISGVLHREPDIVIRFVDRLPVTPPVRLLGIGDVAFTEDAFLLLSGKHRTPVRVRFPFEHIGRRCEIVCERGISAVPLLIGVINLTVLAKGGLALHASAFRHAGTDVLVTGWSKGGKTELLLAFAASGAQYIGDEWIYVSPDGERVFGIPEPIRVWDWHLEQLPTYRRQLATKTRARLRALRHLSGSLKRVGLSGPTWQRRVSRFVDLIERQRYAHLEPQTVFAEHWGSLEGCVQKVIFIASHQSAATTIQAIEPYEVAARMIFSLEEERARLMSYYRRFRFAFPDKANPLIEGAAEIEKERLHRFLEGKECYAVYHPYPPVIADLFDTVHPVMTPRNHELLRSPLTQSTPV